MMEMMYMLVIPPEGDIEQVEYDIDPGVAFAEIQRRASVVVGRRAHVENVTYLALDDVMLFVDEDSRFVAPPSSIRLNERASWLARRNIVGPAVVTGADGSAEIPGLSLEQAMQVRKMLDAMGPVS